MFNLESIYKGTSSDVVHNSTLSSRDLVRVIADRNNIQK